MQVAAPTPQAVSHGSSFYLAMRILGRDQRDAMFAIYSFCRNVDDIADGDAPRPERLAQLREWRDDIDALYRGEARPRTVHLASPLAQFGLAREDFHAMLEGMEMDARGDTYERWDQLLAYCFRVASTVGLMMTRVMGYRGDVALLRAADLGVAMQLTNIARDVGEDARRGRVYLPRTLLEEHAADARRFAEGPADEGARAAVRELLHRADAHYRAADLGVPLLPRGCRLAIASSRAIYSEIGAAVARNGYDSITTRAYVPLPRKLLLVASAARALLTPSTPIRSLASVGPADAALATELRACGLPVPVREAA
jgi:phytoene synthase